MKNFDKKMTNYIFFESFVDFLEEMKPLFADEIKLEEKPSDEIILDITPIESPPENIGTEEKHEIEGKTVSETYLRVQTDPGKHGIIKESF